MTSQETTDLRKEVKKLLVDRDLDERGSRARLQQALSRKMGTDVHINTIGMALTGHRTTEPYKNILLQLKDLLLHWPGDQAA